MARRRRRPGASRSKPAGANLSRAMYTVLSVLQVFVAVVLVFLVLLHSGKDAGMSGAFGVGAAGGSTGGSLMERNLDRWTIVFAVLFAANTIALLKV